MLAAALAALAAIAYFKFAVLPVLDQRYSVRGFWRAHAQQIEGADTCVKDVRRDWAYGLNYYAGRRSAGMRRNSRSRQVQSCRDGRLTLVP